MNNKTFIMSLLASTMLIAPNAFAGDVLVDSDETLVITGTQSGDEWNATTATNGANPPVTINEPNSTITSQTVNVGFNPIIRKDASITEDLNVGAKLVLNGNVGILSNDTFIDFSGGIDIKDDITLGINGQVGFMSDITLTADRNISLMGQDGNIFEDLLEIDGTVSGGNLNFNVQNGATLFIGDESDIGNGSVSLNGGNLVVEGSQDINEDELIISNLLNLSGNVGVFGFYETEDGTHLADLTFENVTLASDTTLALGYEGEVIPNHYHTVTFKSLNGGNNSLIKNGGSILSLTGTGTNITSIIVNDGILGIGSDDAAGGDTTGISFTGNSTLGFYDENDDDTATITLENSIGVNDTLTIIGDNKAVFTGDFNAVGATVNIGSADINAEVDFQDNGARFGTLNVVNGIASLAGGTNTGGAVNVSAGSTLNLNGNTDFTSLTSAGTLDTKNNQSSISATNANITGALLGDANMILEGDGTLNVANNSNFTGNLNLDSGANTYTVNQNLFKNGASLSMSSSTLAASNNLTIGNAQITDDATFNTTGGSISIQNIDATNGTISATGANGLILGDLNVNNDSFRLSSDTNSSITLNGNITDDHFIVFIGGNFIVNGTGALGDNLSELNFNTANNNIHFNNISVISNDINFATNTTTITSSSDLISLTNIDGTGSFVVGNQDIVTNLRITGDNTNFTGNINVANGSLTISGSGMDYYDNNISLSQAGTLNLSGNLGISLLNSAQGSILNLGTHEFTVSDGTISSTINGSGDFIVAGISNVDLSGANSSNFTGAYRINDGATLTTSASSLNNHNVVLFDASSILAGSGTVGILDTMNNAASFAPNANGITVASFDLSGDTTISSDGGIVTFNSIAGGGYDLTIDGIDNGKVKISDIEDYSNIFVQDGATLIWDVTSIMTGSTSANAIVLKTARALAAEPTIGLTATSSIAGTGSGTTTLTQPVTVTGIAPIGGGGTIALSGAVDLTAGAIRVEDDTTLNLTGEITGGTATFGGALNSGGTVAFNPSSSYGGAIQVSGGGSSFVTLELSNPSVLASGGVLILGENSILSTPNGGTLQAPVAFIDMVDVSSPQPLIIPTSTLYGSTSLGVTSGSTLQIGALAGTDDLTLTGTGLLQITGDSSGFTGSINAASGTLNVNGTLGGSALDVGNDTTLMGSGLISAPTNISGTHAPGNSIGTQTVNGNYTLSNGATYEVEIDNTSSDKIIVTGATHTATIQSGAVIDVKPVQRISNNMSYNIISVSDGAAFTTTNAGLVNDISDIESDATENHDAISYTAGSLGIRLEFVNSLGEVVADAINAEHLRLYVNKIAALVDSAKNENERKVANILENDTLGAGLSSIVGGIQAMSEERQRTAFDSLLPETNGGAISGSFGAIGKVQNIISNRQQSVGMSSGDTPLIKGMFGQIIAGTGNQDNKDGFDGYDTDYFGLMFGVDNKFMNNDLTVGFALGYVNADIDGKNNSSGDETKVDSYQANLYTTYDFKNGISIDKQIGFAYNNYKTTRNLTSAGGGSAYGDFDGQLYSIGADLRKSYQVKNVELTPKLGFAYNHLHVNGYNETGSSARLNVASQNIDSFESKLGAEGKLNSIKLSEDFTLTPKLHAYWLHEFVDKAYDTTAKFAEATTSFTTNGIKPASDRFSLGFGAELINNSNFSLSIDYDLELKEKYYGHNGKLSLKKEF